jgi:hypothetical protein
MIGFYATLDTPVHNAPFLCLTAILIPDRKQSAYIIVYNYIYTIAYYIPENSSLVLCNEACIGYSLDATASSKGDIFDASGGKTLRKGQAPPCRKPEI